MGAERYRPPYCAARVAAAVTVRAIVRANSRRRIPTSSPSTQVSLTRLHLFGVIDCAAREVPMIPCLCVALLLSGAQVSGTAGPAPPGATARDTSAAKGTASV